MTAGKDPPEQLDLCQALWVEEVPLSLLAVVAVESGTDADFDVDGVDRWRLRFFAIISLARSSISCIWFL